MSQHDSDGESHEEQDQEKILDEALLIVKSQAYQMKNAIEHNKLRNSLKFCKAMLDTLKSNILSPASYYQLYTNVFDEMQYIYNYFKEEARRGRRMKDLYDTVQQCESIIPRLFILICVASAYIETGQVSASDIIFDLFNLVKGVQNPLRGLFCRYFLLKMIKDKMPDKGNEYEKVGASPNDTIKFILNNLSEMNSLWIRIKCVGESEKIVTDSERAQFKILVGENITRLSSLNAITKDIYKDMVLPKILEIILDSKDSLSQQYLLECLIRAFPDEYNIKCIEQIIETSKHLEIEVDIISIYINLINKICIYNNNNNGCCDNSNIYDIIYKCIKDILYNNNNNNNNIDIYRIIELQSEFIKYIISTNNPETINTNINTILSNVSTILTTTKNIDKKTIDKLSVLLCYPLESKVCSIFDLTNYPELMRYLDYASRSTISIRIIQSLLKQPKQTTTPTKQINTPQQISKLLDYIRPLIEEAPDCGVVDEIEFEYEQCIVCKVIGIVDCSDFLNLYDMLCVLKNSFVKGGNKRIKYTLPTLVLSLISISYKLLNNNLQYISTYTPSLDTEESIIKFIKKIYNMCNEIINIIEYDYPSIAYRLYICMASTLNKSKFYKECVGEYCYNSICSCIDILNKGNIDEYNQVNFIYILVNVMINICILNKEDYYAICENIVKASQTLLKKSDQCLAILTCSNLYHNTIISDKLKVGECLIKAKKFADFAMTNPKNAVLFIKIINKYVYYLDKAQTEEDIDYINSDNINDLIELVKNHIQSMKHENKETEFLPEIEEYFNNTMFMLNLKRKEGKNKVYSNLMA